MKIVTLHYFIFSVLNNRLVTYPNDIIADFYSIEFSAWIEIRTRY